MVDNQVRMMTWNVWWRFGPRWQDRQPGIVQTIRRARPDVLALQEAWATAESSQVDELADEFGMHPVFAAPSYPAAPGGDRDDFAGVGLGVGLLSRWPVLDREVVPLPARHRSWDPVSVLARLDHPAGPLPVVVTCFEPATVYTDDRIAQGDAVAELATRPELDGPCPVVVLGDLNAAVGSPVLRSLTDRMTDAWAAGGGDPAALTLPSTHPSAPLEAGPELVDQRIDHIFLRPGREDQRVIVEHVAIISDAVDGTFPSDHRPVVADLRWRG
jgi:endonuclease/exonuclease/phosphatase family metal-dependent hydrolase